MSTDKPVEFLFTNTEFQKINAKLHDFNPLKVLKVDKYEIRHSNILAWLFDPTGHHNLDDQFFKSFMIKVLPKVSADNEVELTTADIAKSNFRDLNVQREESDIDLIMTSEFSNLLVFIENKFYAKESEGQLKNYAEKIHEREDVRSPDGDGNQADKKTAIGVFLTLDGSSTETSEEYNYYTASYKDILQLLNLYLETQSVRMSTKVYNFLNYYKEILEEELLAESILDKECKSLYENRGAVIDELLEADDKGGETDENPYRSIIDKNQQASLKIIFEKATEIKMDHAAEQFMKHVENEYDLDYVKQTGIKSVFLTKGMRVDGAKQKGNDWDLTDYPFCLWFKIEKEDSDENGISGELSIYLEVGPFDESDRRVCFLKKLKSKGGGVSERQIDEDRKFAKVYSASKKVGDLTDSEEILDAMIELYGDEEENEELHNKLKKLEETAEWFEW